MEIKNSSEDIIRPKSHKGRRLDLIVKVMIPVLIVCIIGFLFYQAAFYFGWVAPKYYDAAHFGIETVHSGVDFNNNGIDDYADFVLGARKDAKNHPRYDPSYIEGGYPPDDAGVCADVIWRAFKEAGYCLKDMIDKDIADNTGLYPRVQGDPDPNIDFRRVPNLKAYFERFALSLTTDLNRIAEWQPGDIVVYGTKHIGLVSDRRNKNGRPYLIHNAGQPVREEDGLDRGEISGHFRFDASRIAKENLIAFLK